jgi:SPP1 family predicted phage head-tail adaptor
MWKEIINLIHVSNGENALGDIVETESSREVFANKKSVKLSEFYQAQANGLKPEIVFEVMLYDYEGEEKLTFEGESFRVIRTYQKSSEILELICDKLVTESDTNLTALVVTTATLSPIFASGTYTYTSSVLNAVTSVTVTPTCLVATEITVNGTIVVSGSASGSIALVVGANTITVIVRKTGRKTRTYTVTVTRGA